MSWFLILSCVLAVSTIVFILLLMLLAIKNLDEEEEWTEDDIP